jgi:trans-aconitate 2-methyltransferase
MATNTDWDPELYARFEALRSRPFWDLASLLDPAPLDPTRPIEHLVDLGCGSGELTAALARQLGPTSALGIDSSPAMLKRASDQASAGVRFERGDIAAWSASDVDLIVANASLQWVPDHSEVIERWVGSLRRGGQIAIQVPANADHPSHTCSAAVANREPFRSVFSETGDGTPPPDPVAANVLLPEQYSELLHSLGVTNPHVRLQVYPQVMPSSRHVVDWVRGTSLTRFFTRLPPELHQPFVDAYTAELLATIGEHEPYFYAFKRILMAGRLGA